MLERLLVEDAERGEQPARLEILLIEHSHAGITISIRGGDGLTIGEHLERIATVRVTTEVLVHRSGLGDGIEGCICNGSADATANHVVFATVDLAPLHTARLHALGDVASERVERLVVMIVGVERLEVDLCWFLSLRVSHGYNRSPPFGEESDAALDSVS